MCGLVGTHIYADFESREDFASELWRERNREFVRRRVSQYSNMGFALLVMCVEDATGRTIDDIVHDELVVPLGLEDTTFSPEGERAERLTPACAGKLPWLYRMGSTVPEHRLGPALRGTGALFSSAADCEKVMVAYWRIVDGLLAERSLESLQEDDTIGLLKVKVLSGGEKILYRFGMVYGGASFVAFHPSTHRFLVMLKNVTSWPAAEDFALAERFFLH